MRSGREKKDYIMYKRLAKEAYQLINLRRNELDKTEKMKRADMKLRAQELSGNCKPLWKGYECHKRCIQECSGQNFVTLFRGIISTLLTTLTSECKNFICRR